MNYHESAANHFRKCGPFCKHVTLCAACANVFGLCAAHKQDPDGSFAWKRSSPAPRPPRES